MVWNSKQWLVAGSLSMIPSTFALAQGASEPATVRLSHGVLKYNSIEREQEAGGTTTKTETTGLTTFPAGLEIATFVKGYAIYAYPLDNAASLWVGKAINSSMELGATANLSFNDVKDGDESSSNSIGAYMWYTAPLSPMANFEANINPYYVMAETKTTSAGATPVETKTETSGLSLYIDALVIIPITKNFEYGAGLELTYSDLSVETTTGGAPAKGDDTTTNLGLVLAKFRYII